MKKVNQILKIFLAVLLSYCIYLVWAIFAFGGGCENKVPESHILPDEYIGKVYIVFNQEDGQRKEYNSDGSRLYRIPISGILKSRFKGNYGWVNAEEEISFYYERDSTLVPIDKLSTLQDRSVILDSNDIIVVDYGGGAELDFDFEGDILTYIVDSLKNIQKGSYVLTKENFENWDK